MKYPLFWLTTAGLILLLLALSVGLISPFVGALNAMPERHPALMKVVIVLVIVWLLVVRWVAIVLARRIVYGRARTADPRT
jgi:membrane protein implicated in regulation of membrane protease activity